MRFNRAKHIAKIHLIMAMSAALLLACAGAALAAGNWQKLEKQNIVVIGDRVVDIAYNLGVHPAAMGVRCSIWPLCDKIKMLAKPLGCPECLINAKQDNLTDFISKNNVKLVIIEKSEPFCILKPDVKPTDVAPALKGLDVKVEYVDFSKGIEDAIAQTAALLGKEKAGQDLAAAYAKASADLEAKIAQGKPGKRVVVLNGVYQPETTKTFIRVELPGGYSDKFILGPLGCQNVGDGLVPKGQTPDKGHVTIRKLDALATIQPQAIVITGDGAAVQKALAATVAKHPELGRTPVYCLPLYIDSSVIERPQIVGKWLWALR